MYKCLWGVLCYNAAMKENNRPIKPQQDIVFGLHAVLALLEHQPQQVKKLLLSKNRQDQTHERLAQLAEQLSIAIEWVDEKNLNKLTDQHQGAVAHCVKFAYRSQADLIHFVEQLAHPAFLVILDNVQDPHNFGAILRTCDAFGVDAVIIPKDRAVGVTPVVRKVASGAVETLPIFQVVNIAQCIDLLKQKNIWIYGSSDRATQSIFAANLIGPMAMVMGAEGQGMRELTQKQCDFLLKIPMQGQVESLNVSVATGVFLFEALRQRQNNKE